MNANKKSNLIAIFAIAALYSGTLAFAATETPLKHLILASL
jgi:hypothetical protein